MNHLQPQNNRWQTALLRAQGWDLDWCLRLNRYSAHRLILQPFKMVSRLGDGWFWYGMMGLAVPVVGLSVLPALGQTLLTSAVGLGLYKMLKHKTVRPRPYQVHQAVMLGERPLDHFSFPSGHTLHAVLFTIMLGSAVPVFLPVLVPFMLMVGLSRVVLGLHYPSDVLAGGVLGAGLAAFSLALCGV
jgi:undecaprenyl-diphosphatase